MAFSVEKDGIKDKWEYKTLHLNAISKIFPDFVWF